ncbi:hypothetical protein FISHEDRAFT_74336 [Fistulina hepatica ATCC 64428]|uniref:DUF6534 domain-containing protein n=1 Tax=Fistulina hepatica ATCC 64428 TaxID=1128425 RepID=A0A0D7ABN7_9AGAR|nr:hypothetical protein FISHEDRAFT_74336 [Fistulina hepatica ATCC 64428]
MVAINPMRSSRVSSPYFLLAKGPADDDDMKMGQILSMWLKRLEKESGRRLLPRTASVPVSGVCFHKRMSDDVGILFDIQTVVTLLFGVGMVQGWFYFSTYIKKDPWAIQLLVAIVLALETAQMIMVTDVSYRYFVTDAVTTLEEALETGRLIIYPIDLYQVMLTGFIAFFTQQNLFAISQINNLMIATNTLTAVTDIAISGTIIYLLHTSKSGFRRTTDIVNRLIIFTFSTGLPTALAALLSEITAQTNPDTLIYVLFNTFVYTNCLLVSLNSRDYIRGMGNLMSTSVMIENLPLSVRSGERNARQTQDGAFRINVETTVYNSTSSVKEPGVELSRDALFHSNNKSTL